MGIAFHRRGMALAAGLLLTSCAHHQHVAVTSAPVADPAPRPVLAVSLAAIIPPPLAADGQYRTINHGIDPVQIEWHVRAALNVAAIGCRGAGDGGLVTAYNALLSHQKAELALANKTVEAKFRADGGDWQAAHDAYMTRLYNFFSQPAAKAGFCATADRIARKAAATDNLRSFATEALPQLEAPFIETYRQVDAYKLALAQWKAGETVQVASAERHAGAAPKLAYANMGTVLAWQPREGVRIAAR